MLLIFICQHGIFPCHHDLMQLFTLPDPYFRHRGSRQNRLRQIRNLKRRNFGNKRFSALRFRQRFDHKLHAFLQTDPKARHTVIRDRKLRFPRRCQITKKRNHRTAAPRYVSVPDDGKAYVFCPRICVCSNKQFIGHQLSSAVKINRIDRLVRRQRHNAFYAAV